MLYLSDGWCGEFQKKDSITNADTTPISHLGLSVRARNALERRGGIKTIGQLINTFRDELLGIRNFGWTSYRETRRKLEDFVKKEYGIEIDSSSPILRGFAGMTE